MKMKFSEVKQILKQFHGLDISRYEAAFLEKSIEKRMQTTGCDSPQEYCAWLEHNPVEGEILQNSLHIHTSQFFRNPLTFAVLERLLLPELIQKKKKDKRREIRIWSAGCSAGQEAYSLAILLEEALGNSPAGLTYRIFATDLDEMRLNEARVGFYTAEALGNLSLKRAETWFTRQAEGYRLQPALQKNLDFSIFDLLMEELTCPPASIFGDFDLVVCCNVLIYYQPNHRNLMLDKFAHCLARGGYLITGETERAIALAYHAREVVPQAAIFRLNRTTRKNA
jgi:chemotaxis protein methyltransferase CheR